MKGYIFSRLI